MYLGVSHASHPTRVGFQHSTPQFGGFVFLPTTFNAEQPNSAWYTYWEGQIFGQPCHYICTNASHSLSVIAEFTCHFVATFVAYFEQSYLQITKLTLTSVNVNQNLITLDYVQPFSKNFLEIWSVCSWVILLTDKQIDTCENITYLAETII